MTPCVLFSTQTRSNIKKIYINYAEGEVLSNIKKMWYFLKKLLIQKKKK